MGTFVKVFSKQDKILFHFHNVVKIRLYQP